MTEISREPKFDGDQVEVTEAQIEQALAPFVQPGKRPEAVRKVTKIMRRFHSGPLPAPEDFAHYNETLPGGAERIMCLTEREQAHRHRVENRVITGEYATRLVGQAGAMIALVLLVGLIAFCTYIGQPITAGIITAIGAIVIGFLKYSASNVDRSTADKPTPAKTGRKKR